MTERFTRCRYCPRPLTTEESQRRGYGEKCGRDRGLIPPKRRRTGLRPARRPKPAPVPPAPDALPGQDAIPLFYFEPTLDSL
ncbi:DUF6011 domain-containing protein [Streptomyces violaceus]|uniref:DUF6011 domain-containing protein n=1 Tax=Streptomyces violaceus TaxID=1936 RepID=A0ABY9UUW7_STRVL|nr:DUF6011 domain-containing protein [Streptomyces janthinus]WND24066.1 DUF6011 domain-containing protein [Streptomyces janthinus]GGS96467.1 hypothetical protein GCM10010270_80560 [Streptomyces janthinus]